MSDRLQDYENSTYERPNQSWQDVVIDSAALKDCGDLKVRKLTHRAKRKIFTLAFTAFTVGAMLILFNSPFRNEFVLPGPLVSSHAQILAERGAHRCAACHVAADHSFSQWLVGMLSNAKQGSNCQSDLCMECHKSTMDAEFARYAHNLDPAKLAAKTSRYKRVNFNPGRGLKPPVNSKNELACSACHREHHGAADLTRLTDKQCQTWHGEDYHSFETDHPEFTSWPIHRREQIAFDHTSHGLKHFPDKLTSFDCKLCHVDDSFNNVKLLAPYAKTCAHCHDDQIRDSGESGLAVFALPMLDLDAIRRANCDVGNWPKPATGDFDGPIPPVMRVLLSTDGTAQTALNYFDQDFNFSDVDPENEQHVKFACDIVWAIKYLLYDLSVEGPEAIRKRLEIAAERPIGRQEMADLAADLNEPVFQDAVRRWLPGLNVEVAKHRWGSTTMKIGWIPGEILARYEASTDEWLAPNPLNGLIKPLRSNQDLDLTGQAPPTLSRPTSASPPASPHQTGQAATPPRPTSPQTSQLTAEGSEVLAQNPLQKLMGIETLANQGDTTIRTPEPPVQDPGLANNDTNPGDQSLQPQTNSQETSVEVDVPNNQPLLKELLGVVPVISNGGWFRDDQVFQVTYRPGGHADRCIQSWTDFVAEIPDANIRTDTSSLFAKLTSASGVGKCRSCHTVDQMDDNSFRVNWEPNYRDVSFRSFTRFSHGSHVMQPMLQDCKHCHELDSQRSNKDSFISFDSSQAISNFKPIQKANCTTCHREGQTSNSCTQCHNYHIGSHVIGTNHK